MTSIEEFMEVCKKRAIIYPSAEIYGGFSGFYDYGSNGAPIKRKFTNVWRQYFMKDLKENFIEIDPCIGAPEAVFKASGHLENFNDPVLECSQCGEWFRADHLFETKLKGDFDGLTLKQIDETVKKNKFKCGKCGNKFLPAKLMNLMFSSPLNAKTKVYFRPETTQAPAVNFKREFVANRQQLPIGIAVIGKVFRNEISARQGLFRGKEFTQAEIQIFIDPKDTTHPRFDEVKDYELNVMLAGNRKKIQKIKAKDLAKKYMQRYVYYMCRLQQFWAQFLDLKNFRFYEKIGKEKAFYNQIHFDVEYNFKCLGGFKELHGFHYRGDHDLKGHQKESGKKIEVIKDGKTFLPHIIELSFGIDRAVLAILDQAFKKGKDGMYFSLPKQVAPYDAAVFPLVKKDGLKEKAQEIYDTLRNDFDVFFDISGSVGRRYARVDEIGVPIAITVDYDTMKDGTVTIRDRDTQKQKRVKISDLKKVL